MEKKSYNVYPREIRSFSGTLFGRMRTDDEMVPNCERLEESFIQKVANFLNVTTWELIDSFTQHEIFEMAKTI